MGRQQQEEQQRRLGHGHHDDLSLPTEKMAHPGHAGDAAPNTKTNKQPVRLAARTAEVSAKTGGEHEQDMSHRDAEAAVRADAGASTREPAGLPHG